MGGVGKKQKKKIITHEFLIFLPLELQLTHSSTHILLFHFCHNGGKFPSASSWSSSLLWWHFSHIIFSHFWIITTSIQSCSNISHCKTSIFLSLSPSLNKLLRRTIYIHLYLFTSHSLLTVLVSLLQWPALVNFSNLHISYLDDFLSSI